jgi:hypothetical protein
MSIACSFTNLMQESAASPVAGTIWAKRFPTLVTAAGQLQEHAVVLDAEVVVTTDEGDTGFSALELRLLSPS